jgi:PKD repeat protein
VAVSALICCAANLAEAASIGTPSYAAGSSPTDLTAVGSSDWALYGKQGGPTQTPSVSKSGGTSITMLTPVITSPCAADNTGISRSSATFSWTGGTPTASGSVVDPYDNGFNYGNAATNSYYDSYETLTFVPGDTNLHVIHLYGYLSNDNTTISLQFSNSIAGASPVIYTKTSPSVGSFDYSISFQADNPLDALTVVFTFQKISTTSGTAKRMGIQAAAMDGQPPGTNWRVIADDTNYPTRDAIVAGVIIGDTISGATFPADPTNNDCSAYFQAALNLMSSAGGGTVFVPAGIYCFSNSLTVPGGVTLRGRWVPPGPTQPVTGTIFKIYAGQGDTNAAPFISQGGNGGGLQGLAFWYPNQWATNWQYYPYTIRGNVQEADELTLVNSYQGIYIPTASFTYLTDIYGTPLTTGFFMDNGPAFPRFYRIKFAPDYWRWSGLPGSPTNVTDWAALTMNMLANTNSVAVDIRSPDGGNLEGCVISGYCYGIRNANSLNANPPSGHIDYHNNVVTNCTEAHRVDYTVGINCYNCIFGGTTNGIAYHYVSGRGDSFYGCTLQGGSYAVLDNANSGRLHTLSFQNCTLSGQASINNYATLAMIGSSFTTAGSNLILNSGVRGVTIIGGTNCGPASIVNNSGLNTSDPTVYFVSTKPTQPEPVLLIPYPNVNHPGWRRPLQSRLFNVVNYGAKGDGVTDDTAAIRAAITAAHTNGGGIVFFPAAFYLVSQPLSVTNGVELRGIYGLLNSAVNVGSTLVINTGANNTNAPPFITLGDYCGIRGINVQYANQTWSNGVYIPYPYTIQCGGVSNYVWNCVLGNSYQGVDFKGARNGVADGCCMSGLVNAYKFEGGTTNCLVQFGGVKPLGYWPGPGAANGDGNFNSISKTAVSYILADCTNVTVNAIFTHCAYALASVQGGDQINLLEITGERLQNGMLFESGGANVLMQDSAPSHVNCTQGTGAYDFWLKTNFSGTVTALGAHGTYEDENYTLLMDSTNATFAGYNIDLGGGNPLQAMKVTGTAAIYGGHVGGCTLEVPAGGKFTVVDSTLGRMPYVPQAGLMDWSTNCQPDGVNFLAVNFNIPTNQTPVANGITVNTSNLKPIVANIADGLPNPYGDVIVGWHLANGGSGSGTGSNNFNFHVNAQPNFTNGPSGAWPTVSIEVYYSETTDGSLTVWYDSTSGMKAGATYTLYATNTLWNDRSFTVSDARFAWATMTNLMLVVSNTTPSNCDPVVEYVAINSTSYLGVPPPLTPPPPVAGFTVTPTNGIRPLAVTFTDASTGTITNLLWSFGDSQTTNTPAGGIVSHTYPTEGAYTVSLKASGPGGSGTNTQTGSVTVLIPNPPQITSIHPAGTTTFLLQGVGGPANGGYYYWLRSSTNIALPLTNWSIVATNPFDFYGNFSNQIPLTPGTSQQFYRMQMP